MEFYSSGRSEVKVRYRSNRGCRRIEGRRVTLGDGSKRSPVQVRFSESSKVGDPGDPGWGNRPGPGRSASLSVVIPALDAAREVGAAVRSAPAGAEVIVVDGGSLDRTVDEAKQAGAEVLCAPAGRASQLNRGAGTASGDTLLFLHADCRLPGDAREQIGRILAVPETVGGWFPQRVAGGGALLRYGAAGANRRARWLRLPYGDQAIFTTRDAFERAGGFPPDPIMEDAGFARRLRRLGRLSPAASFVTTGAEHWERLGPVLTAALDYLTLTAWLLEAPPARIARVYHRLQRGPRLPSTPSAMRGR